MAESGADPIRFGRSFVHSEAFRALFQEGMGLVEETAAYLDGRGREDSRSLIGQAMTAYASESMRLTTRLMQVASWLLVQRAVAEGDPISGQARRERDRLRQGIPASPVRIEDFERLPSGLRDLVGLAARLHARILHLDMLIADAGSSPRNPEPAEKGGNPVAAQRRLLERAFGEPAEA